MNPITPITAQQATLTFPDWEATGQHLHDEAERVEWEIGDWLLRGTALWGEDAYRRALEIFDRDGRKPRLFMETCKAFPPDRRDVAIPFVHYANVRALPAPEADKILDMVKLGATPQMTRGAAKAALDGRQADIAFGKDEDRVWAAYRLMCQAINSVAVKVPGITTAELIEARNLVAESLAESNGGSIDV